MTGQETGKEEKEEYALFLLDHIKPKEEGELLERHIYTPISIEVAAENIQLAHQIPLIFTSIFFSLILNQKLQISECMVQTQIPGNPKKLYGVKI